MTPAALELFDANAWIGDWPFALRESMSASALSRRMRASDVTRALVSPLESVLAPDPMPGNRSLISETRRFKQLVPLPIINPRLGTWREQLEECVSDPRVTAVRILPTYHNFKLGSPRVAELLAALEELGLGLVVTARLEDERQQYFALRIKGVPVKHIAALCAAHRNTRILLTGLYLPEVEKLAATKNLLVDTSMTEWADTLGRLRSRIPADRICFGTLAPFLSMQANAAKVTHSTSPIRERRLIGSGSLKQFLKR